MYCIKSYLMSNMRYILVPRIRRGNPLFIWPARYCTKAFAT